MLVTQAVLALSLSAASYALSADELAASFNLTSHYAFEFPTSALLAPDASYFITNSSSWNVRRISNNPQNVQFISDPFPDSQAGGSSSISSATALAITYPDGSYSHDTGGTQFVSLFNDGTSNVYQTMILSYEIAFSPNFIYVKGGKLPGLRGGTQNGCSGGSQPDGTDCFSMRLMWRAQGVGEAYAYIPTPNNICAESGIRCNEDGFGVSIDRSTFSFPASKWQRITMLVSLNDPTMANGQLWMYYNDNLAIRQRDIFFRSTNDIANVTGMFFSTFFGGSDTSWATPIEQYTYYRNIQMWAGTAGSNVTGTLVQNFTDAARPSTSLNTVVAGLSLAITAATYLFMYY